MWSRVVEIMLGCWLAVSPFVFRHAESDVFAWANDFACAAAVITLGLLSFWRPLRRAHLLSLAVGGWLIASGYMRYAEPAPAAAQNNALIGFLLLMFALIPSEAARPPQGWEEFEARTDRE